MIHEVESFWYKIGWSELDPEKRLAMLRTGNPHALIFIGTFAVSSRSAESALH